MSQRIVITGAARGIRAVAAECGHGSLAVEVDVTEREALRAAIYRAAEQLGVDVGVAYLSWIDTDMVRGGDEHPAFARMRSHAQPPFHKTYPVSATAQAVADGVERRARAAASAPVGDGGAAVSTEHIRS